jgi:hypothetical protein
MKRTLMSAVAALALLLGAVATAPASQAASNGSHYQWFTCTSGGTEVDVRLYYEVFGIGSSAQNQIHLTEVYWQTAPNALLNRISVSVDGNDNGTYEQQISNIGGSVSTLNDVASSGTYEQGGASTYADFDDNTPGMIRVQVWGGVGNSTDTCWRSKAAA